VAKHLGDAVDKVRRKENKSLRAPGDDRLAGTRDEWLRNPVAMEPKDRQEFAALRKSGLKTARAWALKETAMAIYSYIYERPARKHFRWWHGWAVKSQLQPMIEVTRMLKRHFENIITYAHHRVTNATSESINAKIQWVNG
jgi:transposase